MLRAKHQHWRAGQTELFCRALYNGEEISRASAPLFDADTGVLTTTASCGCARRHGVAPRWTRHSRSRPAPDAAFFALQ